MTALDIITHFYAENAPLYALLLHHSRQVRDHALRVVDAHPELGLNRQLIDDGAMLHDIGIIRCDAPGIHCHGTEPYLHHGPIGAEMLRSLPAEMQQLASPLDDLARICERHTGTGLPGYEPETLEEQVVCYADKFYSKSHPERERNAEQTAQMLSKFGDASVERFLEWHLRFG